MVFLICYKLYMSIFNFNSNCNQSQRLGFLMLELSISIMILLGFAGIVAQWHAHLSKSIYTSRRRLEALARAGYLLEYARAHGTIILEETNNIYSIAHKYSKTDIENFQNLTIIISWPVQDGTCEKLELTTGILLDEKT